MYYQLSGFSVIKKVDIMVPARKLNHISLQMKSFNEYFKKRQLSSVVIVSKHFTERFNERQIDLRKVYAGLKYIADNICVLLYEFERGINPHVQYEGNRFILEKINEHIYVKTIYGVKSNYNGVLHNES